MVACCVGHTLLLTAGIGGFGTILGAVTGNAVLVVVAAVVTVAVSAVALRRAQRHRPTSSDRSLDHLDAVNTGTSTETTAETTDKRTQPIQGVPGDPAGVGKTTTGQGAGRVRRGRDG